MANQEHIDLLKQGSTVWNAWRIEHPEEQPELDFADLFGIDLSKTNLSEMSFREADFSGADLSGIELSNAVLNQINFSKANLSNASLREAVLSDMNFNGANLNNTDLGGLCSIELI